MGHEQPEWIKLADVVELARRAQIGAGKIKSMLREDRKARAPVVQTQVFPGCTRRRYGRASVCRLLQITEQ